MQTALCYTEIVNFKRKPMKIAWVSSFSPDSIGVNVFLKPLAEELKNLGFELDLFNVGDLYSYRKFLSAHKSLSSVAGEYDLIHSQWGSGCAFLTSTIPGKKILTLRGSDWWFVNKSWFRPSELRTILGPALSRFCLSKFNAITVVSQQMSLDVKRFNKIIRPLVLPTPIDLAFFPILNMYEARARLGYEDDNSKWILFVSAKNDTERKRPHLARQAYEYASNLLPDVKFFAISGVSRELIPLWYCASNVLLLTSTHEGWPNVIKESLACNTPFVSTNVGDLRDLADDTASCWVVDDTPESLGKALVETLSSDLSEELRPLVLDMSLHNSALILKELYLKVFNE